ncbi:MAG: FAD-dependent oxidoreductase, partial [Atopobiaceae bacterium]|nr:FAD-dependent oxidoreductase [Atopobiaceae bacterium]
GAGPAGLSAAIYASRAMLDFVVIEQLSAGGQVLQTTDVDNYPGVPATQGYELMDAFTRQAKDLGATIVSDMVKTIDRNIDATFNVVCAGQTYTTKAIIVATGATPRPAGFENEQMFQGRGVSYCGTCDGMFYRNKLVYAIGGGNTAVEEALFLTRFASKVILCVRKDHLRAQPALAKELAENPKVEIRFLTSITGIDGTQLPATVRLRNNETGEEYVEEHDEGSFGVFVFVGYQPVTDTLGDLVELSAGGAVITNERMETATPGLFCAGDIREKPLRQIITAASDGAIAASMAASYLGLPIEG